MPLNQRVPAPEALAVAASPIHERVRYRPATSPTTAGDKKRLSASMLSVSSRASQRSGESASTQHAAPATNAANAADQLLSPSSPTSPSSTPAQLVAAGYSSRIGISRSEPPTPLQLVSELETVDEDVSPDSDLLAAVPYTPPPDKASRLLGIRHEPSMQPIPASARTSLALSTHSAPGAGGAGASSAAQPVLPPTGPVLPLTSLYLVSGLAKSPQTWTLSDPDSTLGLHHSEGAVNRWWRPEVLGSTVSPGAGGPGKKGLKKKQSAELLKGSGALSKQDVAKMLSKALKVSLLIFGSNSR
jgi:EEF1A N-terminal glycine/lysine methyltransferase